MNMNDIKDFCNRIYTSTILCKTEAMRHEIISSNHKLTTTKLDEIERVAQKEAIKQSIIQGMKAFPAVSAADIWSTIYEIHVHSKSGIDNSTVISQVISADQSWKKSSGHAFEEMIKQLSNEAFTGTGIEVVLQRDLNILLKAGEIANEPRDISWLKEQIKGDVFDLYSIIWVQDKAYCFGCVQCKTSIRDRVTRDREPSLHAMQSFFWSVAIVLDGSFLKLPKFISMVNGGDAEHQSNGWHCMYVFTEEECNGRIYPTDVNMTIFKSHAVLAAKQWLNQRQWFNETWTPDMA